MKIGIISDTHENMPMITKAVNFFNQQKVDIVFHAGDIISPITFNEFKNLTCKIVFVFGNNDGEKRLLQEKFKDIGEFYYIYYETELLNKKILLLHEPLFLDILIQSQKYDVIIYGHTHNPDIRFEGKTLIINPGEAGAWLTGKSSIALLFLRVPEARIITLT